MTLVAASDDGGTNTLVCSPPLVIPLAFGTDSFRRHRQAALRADIEPRVLTLPRIALDIDRPADLHAILAQPNRTRTQSCLHASGVAERLRQGMKHPSAANMADSLTTLPRG
ncbi:2-phospho-L-lactate guanylyltransferase [compost metagenome]